MLIKLYTRGAVNHLHIIEDISHVSVIRCLQVPGLNKEIPTAMSQSFEHLDMSDENYVLIKFTDNRTGEAQGVRVYNHAYICNNDGKTIEKVFVSDFFSTLQVLGEESKAA